MNKLTSRHIKKIIALFSASIIIYYGNHLYHYSLPGVDDFELNGNKYIEIVNLLNTDEYRDVVSLGGKMKCLELVGSKPDYCQKNIQYEQKYVDLMNKATKIKNTYFKKCPNGIIKISKGGWINRMFEVVYVYSKNGFPTPPHYMKEKINDQIITYLNYDGTYSSSNACNVK